MTARMHPHRRGLHGAKRFGAAGNALSRRSLGHTIQIHIARSRGVMPRRCVASCVHAFEATKASGVFHFRRCTCASRTMTIQTLPLTLHRRYKQYQSYRSPSHTLHELERRRVPTTTCTVGQWQDAGSPHTHRYVCPTPPCPLLSGAAHFSTCCTSCHCHAYLSVVYSTFHPCHCTHNVLSGVLPIRPPYASCPDDTWRKGLGTVAAWSFSEPLSTPSRLSSTAPERLGCEGDDVAERGGLCVGVSAPRR